MIPRLIEGAVFAGLAILLHLAVFWAQSGGAGQNAGGAGGGSSVTMAGASAEMNAMIAKWDVAPVPAQTAGEMMVEEPATPEEITTARMTPPVMATPKLESSPPQAPELVQPLSDAAAPSAPPVPAPASLQPPGSEVLAMPTPSTPRAGLAVPSAPAAPFAHSLPEPQIEPDPVAPQMPEVGDSAPETAPPPQAKPKPPRREVANAAPVKPKAERRTQPAQAVTAKAPVQDATGGDSVKTAPASVAAGTGGGGEAGADQARASDGGGVNQTNLIRQWGGRIRRSIEENKRYPRASRRSGAALVAMTIAQSGNLITASISRSSGHDRLDDAALKAVNAAAPFAPAPDELSRDSYSFVLQVVFER